MWKRRNVANITVVTITVMDAVWSKFTRGARVATVFSCNIILTKKHFDNQWDWVKMNVWHSFGCLKMWRWMLTWGEFTSPATRAATLSGHVIAVAPVPAEKNKIPGCQGIDCSLVLSLFSWFFLDQRWYLQLHWPMQRRPKVPERKLWKKSSSFQKFSQNLKQTYGMLQRFSVTICFKLY